MSGRQKSKRSQNTDAKSVVAPIGLTPITYLPVEIRLSGDTFPMGYVCALDTINSSLTSVHMSLEIGL